MTITRDPDVLSGDPRIAGTRVGVHHVYDLAVVAEHPVEDVADQLGISVAAVYEALSYYHDNLDEMAAVEDRHRDVEEQLADVALEPPKSA